MRRRAHEGTSVALLLPDFSGGGAERVTLSIAAGLLERGLEVRLIVGNSRGPLASDVPPGLPVTDLRASRMLIAGLKLYLHLARNRPSVVIGALTHSNVIVALASKLRLRPIPCVVVEHNTLTLKTSASPGRRDRLLPRLCRLVYPLTDRVAAVSPGVASDLASVLGRSASTIRVLYNPIYYAEIVSRATEPTRLDWPVVRDPDPVQVLAVGRLTAQKDFATLLVAMTMLPERFSLLILGEGEERVVLTDLTRSLGVEARVRLGGFVDNPYPYMDQADVFVMSSRWEGLPTVLLEALAFRAGIVSTDCPSGPRDILEDGALGQLVAVGDAAALGAAILLASAPAPGPGGDSVRRYDSEAAIDSYVELVSELAGR
jgi:glycosyltransferase involved in cell wall biosynthesis